MGFFFLLLKFNLVLRSKYFLLFLSMGISLPCLGVRELLSVEELPAIKSGLKGHKLGRVLGEWRIICWNNTLSLILQWKALMPQPYFMLPRITKPN